MAEEWFEVWRLLNDKRMTTEAWTFAGPSDAAADLQPSLALYRTAAARNHSPAERRFLRTRALAARGDSLEVWEDGVKSVGPSGDESLPVGDGSEPLNLPAYFPLPLSSLDPRLTVQTLKLAGFVLESGSTSEA